jgi:hypothetical protein
MDVFKRYNTVTDEELMRLVPEAVDTYMDTTHEAEQDKVSNGG